MDIVEAIRDRHCVRAFLDKPVSNDTIQAILDVARWAPSGVNSQPWLVSVVRGASKQKLGDAIIAARTNSEQENPDYRYYPEEWNKPYSIRRKQCGLALYQSQGIGLKDTEKRLEAWYRNYRFFDAPVGLLFFIDAGMETGSWLDMGMFLQNIMLAARHFGLETCPQASLAEYPDIVRKTLGIEDKPKLICGMALGYADPDAPVNQYRLEREAVENFTHWYD